MSLVSKTLGDVYDNIYIPPKIDNVLIKTRIVSGPKNWNVAQTGLLLAWLATSRPRLCRHCFATRDEVEKRVGKSLESRGIS